MCLLMLRFNGNRPILRNDAQIVLNDLLITIVRYSSISSICRKYMYSSTAYGNMHLFISDEIDSN